MPSGEGLDLIPSSQQIVILEDANKEFLLIIISVYFLGLFVTIPNGIFLLRYLSSFSDPSKKPPYFKIFFS